MILNGQWNRSVYDDFVFIIKINRFLILTRHNILCNAGWACSPQHPYYPPVLVKSYDESTISTAAAIFWNAMAGGD